MQSFLKTAQCLRHRRRFYSTKLSLDSLTKWRLQGLQAPKSILEDDDTPVDLSEDLPAAAAKTSSPQGPPTVPTPLEFARHRQTMKKRFSEGWNPPKKISRQAMHGLRDLHRIDPHRFTTPILAEKFKISPEAVRRILKSSWDPPPEKKVKQVEKERLAYDQFVSLNRLRERLETHRVLAAQEHPKNTRRTTTKKSGGGAEQDRFTFQ